MNNICILNSITDLCGFEANAIYQLLTTENIHGVQKVKREEGTRMRTLLSLVFLLWREEDNKGKERENLLNVMIHHPPLLD